VRLRDDLELSLLTEYGPEIAALIGDAWQRTYDLICELIGVDPRLFDEFEDTLEQAWITRDDLGGNRS